jgi:hypothetical protein
MTHQKSARSLRPAASRLGVFAFALSATLALTSAGAWARRPATVPERAAVVRALEGRAYPPKCAVVYISTVNRTWASEDWIGETGRRIPAGCQKYAANGITIAHVARHHWRAVTAGSSFMCPVQSRPGQPRVPNRVLDDLIRSLHC